MRWRHGRRSAAPDQPLQARSARGLRGPTGPTRLRRQRIPGVGAPHLRPCRRTPPPPSPLSRSGHRTLRGLSESASIRARAPASGGAAYEPGSSRASQEGGERRDGAGWGCWGVSKRSRLLAVPVKIIDPHEIHGERKGMGSVATLRLPVLMTPWRA